MKYKEDYFVNPNNKELIKLDIENDHNSSQIIRNKLGQLEDIEEELGIELSIVIKGAINGIWYNGNGTLYFDYFDISLINKCFRRYIDYCRGYDEFYFKDYGKTWALTKEELEK